MASSTATDPFKGDEALTPAKRFERIKHYFMSYFWWFMAGALMLVLTNIMALAIPERIGFSVHMLHHTTDATKVQNHDTIIFAGLTIITLAIGAGITRILSRIFIFNAGRFIEFDLRNDLYHKLTTLDASFYGHTSTGDITSRVTNDVGSLRVLFALCFLHIINASLAFGLALTRMLTIDPWLTLCCLLPYPFLLLGIRAFVRGLFVQTKVVQARLADISTRVQENLSGISVVKAFNLQKHEISKFEKLSQTYYLDNMKLATLRGGLNAMIMLVAGTGTVIVLLVGSGRIDEFISLGQFVEFNGYVVALAFPTSALGWVFAIWHRGMASLERASLILDHTPHVQDPNKAEQRTLPDTTSETLGSIEFKDVSFCYPSQDQTLQDINMSIKAGSTVAIVGKTGCGKSTLVKLMARLYDPTQGSICLDGVPIDKLQVHKLRAALGHVPQDPFLFSMTIKDNVRFGIDPQSPKASHEHIMEALEVAGLKKDIDSFPKGVETMVGERGITLSGGQKQRLTIARALITDPRILILDDSLSSVDAQTESTILDHLDESLHDRTCILITHRYNALPRVDHIFVLDEGRIKEQGTHQELLEASGLYAQMYAQQKLRESLDS